MMPADSAHPELDADRAELIAQIEAYRLKVAELEGDKRDLEVMLETSTAHHDGISESLEAERVDLTTMLEMTSEHADAVEEELHERALATAQKSASELRMIVEATPAPVLISRLSDGEIVYANAIMGQLVKTDPSEIIGKSAADFYYDASDRLPLIQLLSETGALDRREIRFRSSTGDMIWVEISLRLLNFNDEPSILSALHDITARKVGEERLKRQVEALRDELEDTSKNVQLARYTGTTRFENLNAERVKTGSTHIVAFHSYRGGNGKTIIAANVAGLLAASGQRVGVIDSDLQSPGLHVLVGRAGKTIEHTLDDYLLGNCQLEQLAINVTGQLGAAVSGQVFLVPASINPGTMAQIISQGYEAELLIHALRELSTQLQLDVLIIDTHSGLNEEALLTIQSVDTLAIVLRDSAADLEGTGVAIQIARQLEVPQVLLVVNEVRETANLQSVRERIQKTFNCQVSAMVPQSPDLSVFADGGLFALQHSDHPVTIALQRLAKEVVAIAGAERSRT
jgi:PAS domain S-box-containing protein